MTELNEIKNDMIELNEMIIKSQEKYIEALEGSIEIYKRALIEIESQLEDHGGFHVLRDGINNIIK